MKSVRVVVILLLFFSGTVFSFGQINNNEYTIIVRDSLTREGLPNIQVDVQIIKPGNSFHYGPVQSLSTGIAVLRDSQLEGGDKLGLIIKAAGYKEYHKVFNVSGFSSEWTFEVLLVSKQLAGAKPVTVRGKISDASASLDSAVVTFSDKPDLFYTTGINGVFFLTIPHEDIHGDSVLLNISRKGYVEKDVKVRISENTPITLVRTVRKNQIKGKVVPRYKPDELRKNVDIAILQDNHVLLTEETDGSGKFDIVLPERTKLDKAITISFTKINLLKEVVTIVPSEQEDEIIVEPWRDLGFPSTGFFIRMNGGLCASGVDQWIGKASIFWVTRYVKNRLALGLELTGMRMKYIYEIETFPSMTESLTEYKKDLALNLYGRLFIWPHNRPFRNKVNAFVAVSLPWKLNNWEFEIGLRPYQSRIFMAEVQGSLMLHNAKIEKITFNPFGNATSTSSEQMFTLFYLGVSLIFTLSGL